MHPLSALGHAGSRALLLAAFASALVGAVVLFGLTGFSSPTFAPTNGVTIVGKISIVLCPEPAVVNSSACQAPPQMYSTRQLVLTSPTGSVFNLPLNSDGTFAGKLPPGQYQVAISNCNFLGCNLPMPATISVVTNSTSSYFVCFNCVR